MWASARTDIASGGGVLRPNSAGGETTLIASHFFSTRPGKHAGRPVAGNHFLAVLAQYSRSIGAVVLAPYFETLT